MRRHIRRKRIMVYFLVLLFCFSFLALKLFKIQIIEGEKYASQAVKQRSHQYVLDTGRGDILDRDGVSLTDSYRKYVIVAFPVLIENMENTLKEIQYIFKEKGEGAEVVSINDNKGSSGERAVKIASGIKSSTASYIRGKNLPGILVAREKVRYGPHSLASHLVGYVGNIGEKELWEKSAKGYTLTDEIGISGIERMFEEELRSQQPETLSIVLDACNRFISGLGYRYRQANSNKDTGALNVKLTLDSNIQQEVERIMDRTIEKGAVVVMEPGSGDILAMGSRPRLDQTNLMWEDNDFINRCMQNYYPGSIFKIIVAAAALEKEKYDLTNIFNCAGHIEIGADKKHCFQGVSHGEITFRDAMAYSCNTTFIEVGLNLGRQVIIDYAEKFGIGTKTGLYPPHLREWETKTGYLPSVEEMPYQGHLANVVLGQDRLQATPLQVAQMFSIIANNGRLVEPRLVMELTDREGGRVKRFATSREESVLLPSTVNQLKYMLMAVTSYGTGEEAALDPWITAGKTGTAQTGIIAGEVEKSLSWFAGFTPVDRPAAVVVVLIEEGKGSSASHVYSEIMRSIMGRRK